MIRHAGGGGFRPTFAVIPLTIAVVGLTVGRLLVFAIGFTPLPAAGLLTARITAIPMASITTATNMENRPTTIGQAKSLTKGNFDVFPPHPHPVVGWTSGSPS